MIVYSIMRFMYDTLFCEIFENELCEKWEISRKFRILRTFYSQKFSILLNSVFFHEIFAFFWETFGFFCEIFAILNFWRIWFKQNYAKNVKILFFGKNAKFSRNNFSFSLETLCFISKVFFVEFWEIKILHNQARA